MYSDGFPGGPVVKEPAWQHRDTGSIPGLGRPHMPWSDQARVPQLLKPSTPSRCSSTRGAAAVRSPHTTLKGSPHLPQLDTTRKSLPKATKTHRSQ